MPARPTGEPRAEDHHALEADVDDTDSFGIEAAEHGEDDRRHGADGGDEGVPGGEVVRAGDDPYEDARANPPTAKRIGRT